jgi:DNA segregation ATPase FtsK/SpoIIIE-like protein
VAPEPEKPNWPAFDHPAQASVVWDSQGLKIDATNSSLQQILKDVSTSTGVKVDGLTSDQRVFGTYGPGQARDVLSQLLQGSGYNVIMIGDQGQGTPRQILLSARQSGASSTTAKTNQAGDEDDEEEQPATQEPEPPVRPAFPPGTPPRSPQQIMQEMQQRQQQIQQQQQNQPNQPQQPQPQQPQN